MAVRIASVRRVFCRGVEGSMVEDSLGYSKPFIQNLRPARGAYRTRAYCARKCASFDTGMVRNPTFGVRTAQVHPLITTDLPRNSCYKSRACKAGAPRACGHLCGHSGAALRILARTHTEKPPSSDG